MNFNYWFLQTIAMLVTALLLPGLTVSGPIGAFLAVAGLAFINSTVWDAALFFSLPDSLTTHAGLLFLTNGLVFWMMVKLLPGIGVEGILPALLAPVIFTISSLIIGEYGSQVDWLAVLEACIEMLQSLRDYLKAPNAEHTKKVGLIIEFVTTKYQEI